MLAKKISIIITLILGIVSGTISFLSGNFYVATTIAIAIYFSCYLAFRNVIELEEFLKETAIGYFGIWFIIWVIFLNLVV